MPFILDDSDLSIRYSDGDWTKGGVEGEFNSTIHGTRAANAYAVIPFSGKYIEVYGTIAAKAAGSPNPIGTYSIDSGEPVQFSPAIKDTVQHQHLFFTASGLSAGDHTLVIESTVQGSYLGLDFVSYTPSTVLVTTSTSLIWAAPTSNSSPSSSSTNAVTSDFSLPTGIVVGSIFAAIAVTFLCCAALFYCYWRRRREQMKEPKPFPAFIEDVKNPLPELSPLPITPAPVTPAEVPSAATSPILPVASRAERAQRTERNQVPRRKAPPYDFSAFQATGGGPSSYYPSQPST